MAIQSGKQQEKVVAAIQKRILSGRLKPGAALRQIPLAKTYGVSQSVVREGLQTLQQHGLVTNSGRSGFVVRTLDRDELVDAYRVREVLEGLAARLCCRKASPDDIDELRSLAHQIRDLDGPRRRQRKSETEHQFHQYFLKLSGNDTLIQVSIGYRFVGNLVVTERDPDELLEEHLAIVSAVADNDPDEAEKRARLHVIKSADSISRDRPLR